MTHVSEIKYRILRLVGDEDGEQFSSDLLTDSVNAALVAILPWYPQNSVEVITGDGVSDTFALPEDLYRIVSVLDDEEGLYVPASSMTPLTARGGNITLNLDWVEYPAGFISFSREIDSGNTMQIFYGAYWDVVIDDDSGLSTPEWLDNALSMYGASYALIQKASQAANIRQWNVQIDSGTPIMNPVRDQSTYLYERFRLEMDRIPAREKGSRG